MLPPVLPTLIGRAIQRSVHAHECAKYLHAKGACPFTYSGHFAFVGPASAVTSTIGRRQRHAIAKPAKTAMKQPALRKGRKLSARSLHIDHAHIGRAMTSHKTTAPNVVEMNGIR